MSKSSDILSDYPHILFKRQWEITVEVAELLGECKAIVTAISEVPIDPSYQQYLKRVSLIKGARATTAIEGNTLSAEEVEKVAQGESLPPSKEYQEVEVRNILDAMNALVVEVIDKGEVRVVDSDLLLRFHKLIGQNLGEHFDAVPGRFRSDSRVGANYRCHPHEHVRDLIDDFCRFLAIEFRFTSGNQSFSDAVIQAVVAHIYLEWIHPFGDGNGRTGRLLEFYILLRAGSPDIASHVMANHYNETRNEYYRQIDLARQRRSLTSFILYALQGFRDGLNTILRLTQQSTFETAWRTYVYEQFKDKPYRKKNVFKRKRDMMLQMPVGVLMTPDDLITQTKSLAKEYMPLTEQTVKRDLNELVDMGLISKVDGGNSDMYITNHNLLKLKMAKKLEK